MISSFVGAIFVLVVLLAIIELLGTIPPWLYAWRLTSKSIYQVPEGAKFPKTAVIVPCKGDDGRLFDNLSTTLQQDHSDIEYVLVTATADDSAQKVFSELKRRYPNIKIKTVVAGISPSCSQKNNNQIKGIEVADPKSEIFVIIDSDGKLEKNFVTSLIQPLSDKRIGATGGYRWYQPRWNKLPEVLRSCWDAGGFLYIVHPQTGFVFGGGMAFRRSDFKNLHIAELWSKALSDDMTLSLMMKKAGYRLLFVPECIVISREEDSFSSLVSWTTREVAVQRFYNPSFWATGVIFSLIGNFLGLGLLAAGIITWPLSPQPLILLGGLLWITHLWLLGILMVPVIYRLLRQRGLTLALWQMALLVLVVPFASLIQAISCASSMTTRNITWAGVTYHIENSQSMRVL